MTAQASVSDAPSPDTRVRLPLTTTIETTYGCNLNCVHCFNPTHKATAEELTTDALQALIDQLAAAGTLYLGLTGGEPLTRPDLFTLIEYAKTRGMLVTLLTNATLVTPDIADRLQALALQRIDVSMYGATAATYEAVTRVPGSFAKFVRGLELLVARQLPVRLKAIIVTRNAHEVEAMRQFSVSHGLHFECHTDIRPRADGDRTPLAYRITPEEAARIWAEQGLAHNLDGIRQQNAQLQESCLQAQRTQLFPCGCGKSSCGISPYGHMNLCVSYHMPQYDLQQGSVADGWAALMRYVDTATRREDFPCPTCPVEQYCSRNVNDAILEMGDPNACIPHHLRVATLKRDLLQHAVAAAGTAAAG